MDASPEPDYLDEIVEVAGLQGGILPIVGKAEELLVFEGVAGIVETVENGKGRDGGGGAAPLAAELGQLGPLIGLGIEKHSGSRIEQQRRFHKPAPPLLLQHFRTVTEFVEPELHREKRLLLGIGNHP